MSLKRQYNSLIKNQKDISPKDNKKQKRLNSQILWNQHKQFIFEKEFQHLQFPEEIFEIIFHYALTFYIHIYCECILTNVLLDDFDIKKDNISSIYNININKDQNDKYIVDLYHAFKGHKCPLLSKNISSFPNQASYIYIGYCFGYIKNENKIIIENKEYVEYIFGPLNKSPEYIEIYCYSYINSKISNKYISNYVGSVVNIKLEQIFGQNFNPHDLNHYDCFHNGPLHWYDMTTELNYFPLHLYELTRKNS